MRTAFSLLAPSRRRASYCSSSLTDEPWFLAMAVLSSMTRFMSPTLGKQNRVSAKREGPDGADERRPRGDPHHVLADDAAVGCLERRNRRAQEAAAAAKVGPRQALPREAERRNREREERCPQPVENRGRARVRDRERKLGVGSLHRLPV